VIPFEPLWVHFKRVLKKRGAVVLFGSQPFTSVAVMSNLKWFKYCWVWVKNRYGNFILASKQPIKEQEDIAVFSNSGASTTSKCNMVYNPQFTGSQKNKTQVHTERHGSLGKARIGYKFQRNENLGAFPKNVLYFKLDRDKIHPTQKPLALLEYLIRTYTNEGDTVLDPVIGSGTTGHACVNLNRRVIGIEKDADYFHKAQARIEKAERTARQMELSL